MPEIRALFWVTKILTTGMGETTFDFVVTTIEPVIGVAVAFVLLVAAPILQFRTRRYVPRAYWLAVVLVSVFGTTFALGTAASDGLDRGGFGVGTGIVRLVLALAIVLCVAVFMREVSERQAPAHRSVEAVAGNVPI